VNTQIERISGRKDRSVQESDEWERGVGIADCIREINNERTKRGTSRRIFYLRL